MKSRIAARALLGIGCVLWLLGGTTMRARAQQERLSASGSYDYFRRVRVQVTAPAKLVGKEVQVSEAGKPLAKSTLAADEAGRATATLLLPMPPQGKSYADLSVSVQGETPAKLTLPDVNAARKEAFQNAEFNFRPAVFAGSKFPEGDFDQPSFVEDLIGPYTLSATFYDADYNVATTPAKPGRYGAIVEVKNADGKVVRKIYRPLFRQPEPVDWRNANVPFGVELPSGLGIDPAVAKEQAETIDTRLKFLFVSSFGRDPGTAVLLAGLYETRPGDGTTRRNSVQARNQRWWYGLKRKLGESGYRYLTYLPQGYEQDTAKRWPLLVFLHGSGERGDNLEAVKVHGPPKLVAQGQQFPFIIISPQCPIGESWLPEEVMDLITEVSAKYRVDPDRVYLTGLSMGGYGTWATAIQYPDRFAAIAPICGTGDTQEVGRIKAIPVWAFQGGKDPVVSPIEHQKTIDALKAAGGDVKYTVYLDAGHDSWTQTYANPELYTWLLQQQLHALTTNTQER